MVWREVGMLSTPRGRSGRTSILLLAVSLLAAPAFFLGGAAAQASGVWALPTSAGEASGFWTPGRMREARPLEVNGPGLHVPGRVASERRGAARRIAPVAARRADFGSNFEQVADPTAPEFRVHGAIFLALGIFGYARCSGTAVSAKNESVVVTAAHCINSGGSHGRWFKSRWVFIPGYRYGQRPFGIFPAKWLDTTRQWRANGSENFDVGAAVVGRNQRGETL